MVGAIESKIKIRGISGEDTVFTELQLVLNKTPDKVVVKNTGSDQGVEPTLSWFNLAGIFDYQVDIASDSLFSQFVTRLVTLDSQLVIKGLDFDKTYYESNTYLLGKKTVQEGLEKNVFVQKEDGRYALGRPAL